MTSAPPQDVHFIDVEHIERRTSLGYAECCAQGSDGQWPRKRHDRRNDARPIRALPNEADRCRARTEPSLGSPSWKSAWWIYISDMADHLVANNYKGRNRQDDSQEILKRCTTYTALGQLKGMPFPHSGRCALRYRLPKLIVDRATHWPVRLRQMIIAWVRPPRVTV